MLSDSDIQARIASHALLSNFETASLENCTYSLRIGAVFEPHSGTKFATPGKRKPPIWNGEVKHWILGPGECIVIQTLELLKVPNDICAYYHPLNRLAQKGVMLINASVIEPGYEGPLSCFLVNFSSQDVDLAPAQAIAKITFEKVDSAITNYKPRVVDVSAYEAALALSARRFKKSFLGVSGIEERATKAAKKSVTTSIAVVGFTLGALLLFAQLEPIASKYMWEKIGVSTTTRKIEEAKLVNDLSLSEEKIKAAMERMKAAMERMKELEAASDIRQQLSDIKRELQLLKQKRK